MLGSSMRATPSNTLVSTAAYDIPDDILLTLGNTSDGVLVLNTAGIAANTGLTGVLIGTPVAQATAVNSLIISNVTASGDVALYGNLGGHSQQFLFHDTSASMLYLGHASKVTIGSILVNGILFEDPAKTNTAAANYGRVTINSTNAVTLNTGTVPVLASMIINEPNITIGTGAATIATSLLVVAAPTEGTTNAAIYVASMRYG